MIFFTIVKYVQKNYTFQKTLPCCLCKCKTHVKCNKKKLINVNKIDNRYEYSFCVNCKENILPFQKDIHYQPNLLHKPANNITSFLKSINEINETNNFDQVDINDDDNNSPIIKCDYIDIESLNIKKVKIIFHFFIWI